MAMYHSHLQRRATHPDFTMQVGEESGKEECIKDIYQAAIEGDVECLAANLALEVNIDSRGQPKFIYGPRFKKCEVFGATPLQYACGYNREEAVQFLLENGASTSIRSATGLTARDYAQGRGYIKILELLDRHNSAQDEEE